MRKKGGGGEEREGGVGEIEKESRRTELPYSF
jgi:hypothetical protein